MVILGSPARGPGGLAEAVGPRAIGGRMRKLLTLLGATLGGTVGWYAGAVVGFMTGFVVSMIGTGVGMYVGIRVAQSYE
jgi:hypothetical protein